MNDSHVISSDKVEGSAVYNVNGDKLGSIDDLMIDKLSGQVRYAVLEFGGFLGMGTDRYPLPWSMLKYDTSLMAMSSRWTSLNSKRRRATRQMKRRITRTNTDVRCMTTTALTGFNSQKPTLTNTGFRC